MTTKAPRPGESAGGIAALLAIIGVLLIGGIAILARHGQRDEPAPLPTPSWSASDCAPPCAGGPYRTATPEAVSLASLRAQGYRPLTAQEIRELEEQRVGLATARTLAELRGDADGARWLAGMLPRDWQGGCLILRGDAARVACVDGYVLVL